MAKKSKLHIHPLDMADAIKNINEAASMFVMSVSTSAKFMVGPQPPTPEQIKLIAASLTDAVDAFRAAMWPDHV